MKIFQRDIFIADLNPVKGHEQAGKRPVLVLQNDILNRNVNTVIVAPITSNLQAKGMFTTYFLSKEKSGLNKDSIVMLLQMRTMDKRRLKKKVSELKMEDFLRIKQQMKFVF